MTAQPPRLRLTRPIISFDLETTGLDIGNDKVVEICCVKLHIDGHREIQTRRLNPGRAIAPQATAVHGITDADVADCPRFEQAAAELHAFFAGCDLTGFNIEHFDLPFLANEFGRAGFGFPAADARVIDTFRIFTMREPRDLSAALRFYCNRDLTDAHQAEADAIAAADVLMAQVDRYSDLPCDVAGLHSVCRPPEWLDGQGKIIWADDEAVISFGKHKGKSLRIMADTEASYLQWMCRDNKFAPDMVEIIKAALRGQFPRREVMAVSVAVEEAMAETEEVLVELPEPAVAERVNAERHPAAATPPERVAAERHAAATTNPERVEIDRPTVPANIDRPERGPVPQRAGAARPQLTLFG